MPRPAAFTTDGRLCGRAAPSFRGAGKAREPGIQTRMQYLWIPGPREGRVPE